MYVLVVIIQIISNPNHDEQPKHDDDGDGDAVYKDQKSHWDSEHCLCPSRACQAGPEADAGLSLKQQKELQSSVSIIQSQKPELFKLKLWGLTF